MGVTVNDPSITARASNASFQWLDCGNNFSSIPGATNKTFTAMTNGSYSVQVDQQGCIDTSQCVSIYSVGIDEQQTLGSVSIFPNPGTGLYNVNFVAFDYIIIKIFDITGRQILDELKLAPSNPQFKIDQPAGIYIVELNHGDQSSRVLLLRN